MASAAETASPNPEMERIQQEYFRGGPLLANDYVNAYNAQRALLEQRKAEELKHIPIYEVYMRRAHPQDCDLIMAGSDPTAVETLDGLVFGYNDQLPEIREGNFNLGLGLLDQITEFVRR